MTISFTWPVFYYSEPAQRDQFEKGGDQNRSRKPQDSLLLLLLLLFYNYPCQETNILSAFKAFQCRIVSFIENKQGKKIDNTGRPRFKLIFKSIYLCVLESNNLV